MTSTDETMGTVTIEGEAPYTYGEKVTIKATANTGYEFVKWSDGDTNATREITVTSDTTITATFKAIGYTVDVTSADETMGTVAVEGEAPYTYGETITIKATANTGYHFVKWSDESTEAIHEITVTSDTTITATFKAIEYTVALSVNNAAMGTVAVEGEAPYTYGEKVTIKATANNGYEFIEWSDNSTEAIHEITITSDTTITATFKAIEYTVNVTSTDETMGTVAVEGEAPYTYGEKVTIKATANTGYEFVKWSDESTEAIHEITVTSDTTITATFKAIEYTVNVTSADEAMGTVAVEGEAPYTYGEKVTIKATANTGYEFVKWSDESTEAIHEITVTSDTTITATFAAIVVPDPVVTIDNAEVTVDGEFEAEDNVEAKFTVKATDLTADITFEAVGVTFTPDKIAKDNADLATGVEVKATFKSAATKGEKTVTITVKSEGAESKTVTVKYTVTEETGVENVTVVSTVWSESGMLFIEAAAEAQATVYTLQGQMVETLNLTQGVNAVALPSATYVVKLGTTEVKVSVR